MGDGALHDTGRRLALVYTVRGRGYWFVAPVEELRDIDRLAFAQKAQELEED